jgi:hypothetical protein
VWVRGFKTPVPPGNESFPGTNQSFETPHALAAEAAPAAKSERETILHDIQRGLPVSEQRRHAQQKRAKTLAADRLDIEAEAARASRVSVRTVARWNPHPDFAGLLRSRGCSGQGPSSSRRTNRRSFRSTCVAVANCRSLAEARQGLPVPCPLADKVPMFRGDGSDPMSLPCPCRTTFQCFATTKFGGGSRRRLASARRPGGRALVLPLREGGSNERHATN